MTGRPTATTTVCKQCGGALYAGDRFCGSCGVIVPVGGSGEQTPTGDRPLDTPAHPDGFTSYDGWERVVQRLRQATMGEFEIRRELGRGGMAIVFLAHDISLRRKVAIKLMSPGLLTNDEMVRKFREEAVMVAHMNHPNIITIHAVRNVDDLHFFIMKFVEGESLDHALRDTGPMPYALARGILYQVGSALAYAHRRGVIHRDVKPANILIDVDGDAIVTDFGIAKVVDSDTQTKTGSVVGTPAYMSPEQCYAMPATWASDQYSLGVVAYEMIAGAAPFTGPSFVVMKAHADEPVPPITDIRPDCPPELEAAVMRMLAKNPDDRFPSIAQALTALGASPLPEDDPRRVDLAGIVRKSVPTASLTPVSPIPAWTKEHPNDAQRAVAPDPPPQVSGPPVSTGPVAPPAVPPKVPPPPPAETERILPVPDQDTARMERRIPTESTTIGGATVGAPSVGTPRPVAADPSPGVRRRRLGVAALLVASAAVFWFVVLRRPPNPSVTTASTTTQASSGASPGAAATDSVTPAAVGQPTPAPTAPTPTPPSQAPESASTARPAVNPPAATVTPTPPPARSIAILPTELTLMVGQTIRPEISVLGADNQPLAGRRAVWVSPNAAVATVDRSTGAVTGVSVGTTDITATSGPARGTLRVRVEAPVVLTTIAVDQPRRLTVGENITLLATPRDSRGNVMANQAITWSSADPTVATVGANTGVLTAAGAGTVDITATGGGKTTTVRLTVVTPPPPKAESVKATPDPAVEENRARTAIESGVQQYVATLRAHDARRVTSLYRAESDQDRKNQQALMRLMEGSAKLTAAEPRVEPSRIDGANASVEFAVPLSWRNPFGVIRNQTVMFRAEMQRDSTGWRTTNARIVGTLLP
jgi:serine/threonine-protein kinase